MGEYRYKAFISYSHEDERWARWLHRALETYRVPKAVAAGRVGPDRRLRPVFRDRAELPTGPDLGETIQEALTGAGVLIVVCSRSAARSEWVCREIEYFVEHRGYDDVLCLIVDPFEGFPAPLAGREPLAADARASGDGRRSAVLRLVAGMLGVGYDDLARRDRRQRRVSALYRGATISGAMAVAASAALWLGAPEPCPDPATRLSGVWGGAARERLVTAFSATGLAYAGETATKVGEFLDTYTRDWRIMHRQACEATRVDGTQSDLMLDKRMQCLERRLQDADALISRLGDGNADVVEHAVDAVIGLRPVRDCADLVVLARSYPPPAPEQASKIEDLAREVAGARAAFSLGQLDDTRRVLDAVERETLAADYPPLTAQLRDIRGQLQGQFSDAALHETFESALEAAARSRNDAVEAEIWHHYVFNLSEYLGNFEAASRLLIAVRVAARRLDADHYTHVQLANLEGAIAIRQRRLRDAKAAFQRAVTLSEAHPLRLRLPPLANLATVLKDLAEYDAARALALESYDFTFELFGARHPRLSSSLVTLASIEEGLGNPEAALEYLQEALELRRAAYGEVNADVALSERSVGTLLKELGRLEEARAMLERSLETYASLPDPSPYQMAHLKNAIADLETYLGNLPRSERLFRDAIEIWEAHPGNANVAIPLVNLGALLNRKGEHEQALELCSRARDVDEASVGPEHPDLGFALTCIGEALIGLDRPAEARPLLERAVRLRAEVNAWELAWSKFQLGRALYRLGYESTGEMQITDARHLLLENPGPDSWVNGIVASWIPEQ